MLSAHSAGSGQFDRNALAEMVLAQAGELSAFAIDPEVVGYASLSLLFAGLTWWNERRSRHASRKSGRSASKEQEPAASAAQSPLTAATPPGRG